MFSGGDAFSTSDMRAAILAAAMNLSPIAAVDIFRFLRVPAIVWTIRAARARTCSATICRPSESRSRRSWSASGASSHRR